MAILEKFINFNHKTHLYGSTLIKGVINPFHLVMNMQEKLNQYHGCLYFDVLHYQVINSHSIDSLR